MATAKVSAIITTRNRLELLKKAVESVYNQTLIPHELIVVDDASDSEAIGQWCNAQKDRFSKKGCELIYIKIPKDESKGGNHARNVGIKASTGNYIAFLDDDDEWLPQKTEKQLKLAEQTDSGVIYCGRIVREIEKDKILNEQTQNQSPDRRGDMHQSVLYIIPANTSSLFISRKLLDDIGNFDEKLNFWQEYEMLIRAAQVSKFDFVKEPLYIYNIDKTDRHRLTNNFERWKQSVKFIRNKHKGLYRQLPLIQKIRVKRLYWFDALSRATTNGLTGEKIKYKALLTITLPLRALAR